MQLETEIKRISSFKNLELLAHQVVEGFISGMHKSPFHGFSAEFAEHKLYNQSDSTKNIDWKLFAKTDRLYSKCFEEETNLRCHIVIDNSASMHYPKLNKESLFYKNKIGFSILATAVLMNLLKKQRDAVGLSIFSDQYDYYAPEKGSDRHHRMVLHQLEETLVNPKEVKATQTIEFLHQLAEKIHRRSMIVVFTDMFQDADEEALFDALKHLKHNKHKVVLFHTLDYKTELNFDFGSTPRKFIDVESGETISLFSDNANTNYTEAVNTYIQRLKTVCNQNQIQYVPVDAGGDFDAIITTYLVEKQRFK
jgi:uncharacterized protein (DUF58 family)